MRLHQLFIQFRLHSGAWLSTNQCNLGTPRAMLGGAGIEVCGMAPLRGAESLNPNAISLKTDSHECEFGTQNPTGLLYNKIQSLYLLAKIISTCKRIQRILLPHHSFSCHEFVFVFRRAACRDAPFVLPTHSASLRCYLVRPKPFRLQLLAPYSRT